MSSARTLEKGKYEVGENRTHDTYEALPTAVTRLSNTHSSGGLCKKTSTCVFQFIN